MSKRFLGIIDETIQLPLLGDLLLYRSVGAIPFCGYYRLIDFPLSCMRHSYVTNVAIYSRGRFRSLQSHLGGGKSWDLFNKRDGLFFLPQINTINNESKLLSFDHIKEHIEHLLKSKEEYVVITNAYVVTVFDYDQLVQYHIDTKADITEVYQKGERLNIFVLSRKLLIELVLESVSFGYTNLIEVIDLSNRYKVAHYEYQKHLFMIKSIEDYYQAHMDLLNLDVYQKIFQKEKPIITKAKDYPSTYYQKGSLARRCIMADGIKVLGTIENSVVFNSVQIGHKASIKNSIINEGCIIGEGCNLENVILDKECIIAPNISVIGEKDKPLFFKKHSKVANYNL